MQTRLVPRWVALPGYSLALVLVLTAIHVRWLATVFPIVGDAHQRVRSHSRTELAASGGTLFTCTTCNPTRLNVGGLTAQPVFLSGPRSLELLTPS
jgi:hypothetical protein